jgi:hypothetical protein
VVSSRPQEGARAVGFEVDPHRASRPRILGPALTPGDHPDDGFESRLQVRAREVTKIEGHRLVREGRGADGPEGIWSTFDRVHRS